MIYIVFSINWPVPPKHDHQQFLKKEKISSTYPGVSKFSTNQKPVLYRCFQNLGLVLGCKRVQEKAKQGVLCFFSLCVFCSYSCLYECRLCVVGCVPCMRTYVFCLRLFLCFCCCCCFLFWFLILFCFVLSFFFTPFSAQSACTVRVRALCVCVVFTRVCPRACWLPTCVLTAQVRARQCSFIFFYILFLCFFLFRCECLCARCACVLLQSTCVCTYVRCACTLSKQALYARVCVLTAHVRAHQCSFIF